MTFVVTSTVALGIIWTVHSNQVEDRARLHEGITRDLERQARRKTENQVDLVKQQELAKLYRREESREQRQYE